MSRREASWRGETHRRASGEEMRRVIDYLQVSEGSVQQTNSCLLIRQLFPQHHQRYRMNFLPPPPGFRPPPGMAPTREASGSRMPPEGISHFIALLKSPN
jgi:hypothetical protein